MFEINGKYASALITTFNIEEEAIAQITELVNNAASLKSKIVIMPDTHAGAGCVIGTTMTISDRVVPFLIGVDIGCGVSLYKIPTNTIDLVALDKAIHKVVPSGMEVHETQVNHPRINDGWLDGFYTPLNPKQRDRALKSIGTLGGGNHFLEVCTNGTNFYLIIHTGSRNLGKLVAEYHQNVAKDLFKGIEKFTQDSIFRNEMELGYLDAPNREYALTFIEKSKEIIKSVANKNLAYLVGEKKDKYLSDMDRAQVFASINRKEIAKNIFKAMGWAIDEATSIETVHNYLDTKTMILRKGAVSSLKDFLVPLNMRDGTLIFKGKENEAWNNSAPHGAGRSMSRSKAKSELTLDEFIDQMEGIYSSTINQSTLDEAPNAYKPSQEIKDLLMEQYELIAHLKPVYNFKASE